jgi:hypothetical protein
LAGSVISDARLRESNICQITALTFFKKTGTSSFLTGAFFVFIAGLIELQEDAILSADGVMAVFMLF